MTTAAEVRQAGIDTWSPAWYVPHGSPAAEALDRACTVATKRGMLLPEPIMGHRVGWMAGPGMLWAEGHPGGDRLGRPDDLPFVLERLEAAMLTEGVPVPLGQVSHSPWDLYLGAVRDAGFAGVRRVDATVDLATASSAAGFAVMAGVAAVATQLQGRVKPQVWFEKGRPQTVSLHGHGGGKMLARFYDKGQEAGTAAPGRLLRPEDQRRYEKASRRDVTELSAAYVAGKFKQRFAPLWKASKGVTVAGPVVIAEKLKEAVESGEITEAQARNVAGDLLMALAPPERGQRLSRATRYRQKAVQRKLGLVLANGVLQEVEIDLGDVLEAALETDAWQRRG